MKLTPLYAAPVAAFLFTASLAAYSNPETPCTSECVGSSLEISKRYEKLAKELRCLVCQNQSLSDSPADFASDLRKEVETLLIAGKSNQEIKTLLVSRYGDFILYNPPWQPNTWILWTFPFLLLFIGSGIWWSFSRGKQPFISFKKRKK